MLLHLTPAFARNTYSLRSSKLFKIRLLWQRIFHHGHVSRTVCALSVCHLSLCSAVSSSIEKKCVSAGPKGGDG